MRGIKRMVAATLLLAAQLHAAPPPVPLPRKVEPPRRGTVANHEDQ